MRKGDKGEKPPRQDLAMSVISWADLCPVVSVHFALTIWRINWPMKWKHIPLIYEDNCQRGGFFIHSFHGQWLKLMDIYDLQAWSFRGDHKRKRAKISQCICSCSTGVKYSEIFLGTTMCFKNNSYTLIILSTALWKIIFQFTHWDSVTK